MAARGPLVGKDVHHRPGQMLPLGQVQLGHIVGLAGYGGSASCRAGPFEHAGLHHDRLQQHIVAIDAGADAALAAPLGRDDAPDLVAGAAGGDMQRFRALIQVEIPFRREKDHVQFGAGPTGPRVGHLHMHRVGRSGHEALAVRELAPRA